MTAVGDAPPDDSKFAVVLDDGRVAKCWRAQGQPYEDCEISAGLVTGIEPDVVYLRLESDDEEPLTMFLRPDEMLAILYVCSGALWARDMIENFGDTK